MSYFTHFDNDRGDQVGTTKGWGDFIVWVGTLPTEEFPDLHHLAVYGWDQDLADLQSQLTAALKAHPPSESVATTATGLIDQLKARGNAESVLISNGTGA